MYRHPEPLYATHTLPCLAWLTAFDKNRVQYIHVHPREGSLEDTDIVPDALLLVLRNALGYPSDVPNFL